MGREGHELPQKLDHRQKRLFRSLDTHNDGLVAGLQLTSSLTRLGLLEDDPRLRETYGGISGGERFGEEQFNRVTKRNILLIEQALQGSLVIPGLS